MPNEFQNQFDIDKTFHLCQEIIQERKFESLIELNRQCQSLVEEKTEPTLQILNLTAEEDALCILLYYIYYIMLDNKEREIFIGLKRFIVLNNYSLHLIYNDKFNYEDSDEFPIEQKKLYKFAIKILNKYINNDTEDIESDKLNKLIQYIYVGDYESINTSTYLIFMLGFGVFNKESLSKFSYDVSLLRFYNITEVIINRFNFDRDSFIYNSKDEDPYANIYEEIDQLKF